MKFTSIEDIPDPVSGDRLLPIDRPDLWAPRIADDIGVPSITPHELSYIYLGEHDHRPGGAIALYSILSLPRPKDAVSSVTELRQNHVNRALSRVMLHPHRHDSFDLPAVYDAELQRDSRFPSDHERSFFEFFIDTWGVLAR